MRVYVELRHIAGPLFITQVRDERSICGMRTERGNLEFLEKNLLRYHFQHTYHMGYPGLNPALRRQNMQGVIVERRPELSFVLTMINFGD